MIAELKSELQEATERESKASSELQDQEGETKDELRKLKAQVDELSSEQKDWFEKQRDYEAKLGKAAKDLAEAQAAVSEIEHKRKSADGNRTELEVLKAKLAAAEKMVTEKSKAADKQAQLVREELQAEIEDLKRDHERDITKRDQDQKTQGEAYKYKLQYLELSQKELQKERKKWQEKEREYEKAVISITTELRELKLEHQQAVDLHEAYKAHVEAKESARTQESGTWDIKKQAMAAEHQLGIRQSETSKNGRIAQLEREVAKLKIELEDAQEEVERLTLALEGSDRGHSAEASKPASTEA
jgi:chromosome segregation ATPase